MLTAQPGLPLSTFALWGLSKASRRADHTDLLNVLPSPDLDRASILEALHKAAPSADAGDQCLGAG